jgi:hypothetical protein
LTILWRSFWHPCAQEEGGYKDAHSGTRTTTLTLLRAKQITDRRFGAQTYAQGENTKSAGLLAPARAPSAGRIGQLPSRLLFPRKHETVRRRIERRSSANLIQMRASARSGSEAGISGRSGKTSSRYSLMMADFPELDPRAAAAGPCGRVRSARSSPACS